MKENKFDIQEVIINFHWRVGSQKLENQTFLWRYQVADSFGFIYPNYIKNISIQKQCVWIIHRTCCFHRKCLFGRKQFKWKVFVLPFFNASLMKFHWLPLYWYGGKNFKDRCSNLSKENYLSRENVPFILWVKQAFKTSWLHGTYCSSVCDAYSEISPHTLILG